MTATRSKLSLILLCLVASWTGPGPAAAPAPPPPQQTPVPPTAALLERLNSSHPRLLITPERFAWVKARVRSHDRPRSWYKALRQEAGRLLILPPSQYQLKGSEGLLTVSRTIWRRVYTLALVYKIDQDQRFLDRLWQELAAAAAFPHWHPEHFLDTAEMTHAFAIAYDWLHQDWSPEQRQVLRAALLEKGLKPALAAYHGQGKTGWWAGRTGNWNQVCNSGIGLGALSLLEEEPEVAAAVLQEAIRSSRLGLAAYAPDGGYPEGPMYWGYGTFYTVLFLAGLETALGSDLGLSAAAGFAATGFYPLYLTSPTGKTFNLADASEHISYTSQMFWLAKKFQQPLFSWYANRTKRPQALDLLWGEDLEASPAAARLPLERCFRGVEVATWRSHWEDPRAFFVAFKAGSNDTPHGHLDLGTFVLDGLGQRWALDLGADDYGLPGYFGRQRYDYYRLRAEGHNTLVINPGSGPDQALQAVAPLVTFQSHPERPFAITDLSAAYAAAAAQVRRGLSFIDRRHLLLQDEITTGRPSEIWWSLHTRADLALAADQRTACLTQNQTRLFARILAPDQAVFTIRPARPLPASLHPLRQGDNTGVHKLAIRLKDVRQTRLAVLLTPDPPGSPPLPPAAETLTPLQEWQPLL